MLEFPSFNYFAILVGVIFNILLGFFWYDPNSPPGKVWLKEIGYRSEEMKPNPKLFGLNFIFGVLTIFGIALFVAWSGADTFL